VSTITHIQFCPADWLSGCHTLTAAERGVYITLIMMMYDRASPLTEDEGRLARACGLPAAGFSRALNALVDQGKIQRIEGGLFNARVGREIENVMAKSQIARANVEARWAKKPMKTKADPYDGNTDAMLTNNHKPVVSSLRSDTSAPSALDAVPIEKPKQKPRQLPSEERAKQQLLLMGVPADLLEDFLRVRKAHKAPFTDNACFGIIREAGVAGITITEAIRICVERNWRGFRAEYLTPKEPQRTFQYARH